MDITNMTSKEEQIEDLAKLLCSACGNDPCKWSANNTRCEAVIQEATMIINAGYHKSLEGSWLGRRGTGGYDDYYCSVCGMYEEGTSNPNLVRLRKYCSYCGAVLKLSKD